MSIRIIQGDVREELPKLPADSFDCIVTSPPYYGLRDYGCGGQIGLEPTIDEYLETMVAVCRDLRRVLKHSGVFFLNIGDSYTQPSSGRTSTDRPKNNVLDGTTFITRKIPSGLKPKDLCLVPERLGIALQADGWWVRSHIIWAKPNPMPESVTDRPTSAHETIWMLTKWPRYFWDSEAVAEDATCTNGGLRFTAVQSDAVSVNVHGNQLPENYRKQRGQRRNIRNVWSVASYPFPGSHFATMPPEIAERCIKAGSSERGCCASCGAPWVRVLQTERVRHPHTPGKGGRQNVPGSETSSFSCFRTGLVPINETIGWKPSCNCPSAEPIPARVLDPFAGSGTTGLVSDRLGRDCTLIDLNTSYIDMAVNRIRDDAPLFAEVAAG